MNHSRNYIRYSNPESEDAYNEAMADLKSQAEDILNDMPEG